jgi:hypothetical protein
MTLCVCGEALEEALMLPADVIPAAPSAGEQLRLRQLPPLVFAGPLAHV